MKPEQFLETIFRADRELRDAEAHLMETRDQNTLVDILWKATEAARKMQDRREGTVRLERLADLCAQVSGPRMTDALILILDDEDPAVRVAAGEALLDVGYERYAEVARGIERVLEKKHKGSSMAELPWVLAEIGEPSALGLIRRFLENEDAEVCASAIEALATLTDPGAIPALEALVDDEREVSIDDGESETTTTIGELAVEAIAELGGETDKSDQD
ncbi:MAG: HEAT repeat domain-containing protein [Sandaracinaceae bacterium]|jgi:HEAT repeat protein|nr:HEAT repeat domain-containing protein [Sandaracinaceae bacterium]